MKGEGYLFNKIKNLREAGHLLELPEVIEKGLSAKIVLRSYQEEAFRYFVTYYENENLSKNKQIHTLFHMATGSGKTIIMAGLMLYLYTKGYRKFLFFVNQTNILEKTKDNFNNPLSSKYLFADRMEYLGNEIHLKIVDNFAINPLDEDLQICFTTTQKLHMDLFDPKENSLTYQDFENDKIVFISDESHHVNTATKKQTEAEKKDIASWEKSVTNAFRRNRDSILLEFTATADLKDKNVKEKYLDKIIYDYPLLKFRESGYTKEFKNFATNSTFWERALMALIMSEYRMFLFAECKANIKPVVMLKSRYVKDSNEFYEIFFKNLEQVSTDDFINLYKVGIKEFEQALDFFKAKDNTFGLLANSLKNSFRKETSIIMNGKTDNTKENQLLVNSLEDENNPIRIIFAVDMLNEGWDVLNLFDIVRLYDTRQSGGKKISEYTIKEAQLIGRGARYCPFVAEPDQERFMRKYDADLGNKNRILETMLFHSRDDSRYINELKRALIETGLQAENPIELKYVLKESFKESDFFKSAVVFSNKKIERDRKNVADIEGKMKNKTYRHRVGLQGGISTDLIGEATEDFLTEETGSVERIHTVLFKDVPYNILSGVAGRFNELRFDAIQNKYPNVKSLREFLTSDDYLGKTRLEIRHYDDITGRDLRDASILAMTEIVSHIASIKPKFEGSKEFLPVRLNSVLKNKSVYISKREGVGGRGHSQIDCANDSYKLDLSKEDWFVFNDNYGTSEEKLFIKFFKTDIEPRLKEKGLEYYVIRNERIPALAIYSFDHGERFEPDFILFIRKNKQDFFVAHQIFVEAKGSHLLAEDEWKEEFLIRIGEESSTRSITSYSDEYRIMGLPFFNERERQEEFNEAVDNLFKEVFDSD